MREEIRQLKRALREINKDKSLDESLFRSPKQESSEQGIAAKLEKDLFSPKLQSSGGGGPLGIDEILQQIADDSLFGESVQGKTHTMTSELPIVKDSFYGSDTENRVKAPALPETALLTEIQTLRQANSQLRSKLKTMSSAKTLVPRRSRRAKARSTTPTRKCQARSRSGVKGRSPAPRPKHCAHCAMLLCKGYSTVNCAKHGRSKRVLNLS